MYVYGGYNSETAQELTDIYVFDLTSNKWELFYQGGKGNEPPGRSDFAMIEYSENLIIFGGTCGAKTLNDMWIFDTKNKTWKCVEGKDTPEVFLP